MARKKKADPTEIMVVNDSPGGECRIAVLQDNHLEELYVENAATATNVGSIYKGRVTNVEPAIQAAFVDFGQGASGFLHISDLHPRYFPGKERTEQVGKKIPRRDRPPIQEALRRGDEVLVQVLKEGLGTKGPTLTSYLSIPGRLVVLMPEMDRVGVTRKIEDDDVRRAMRKVLDGIDLPDGFGFILRTAAEGQTKTEIKRDVAYLMRLWKVMEKRIKSVGAPCELFTESNLLLRTVRDVLRPSIKHIIVDSDAAYERLSGFMRVVAPRSATKVIRYRLGPPIFHAFDVERQIDLIHSREVPLHSGGRLVIDQTEACVAIDVNSGRSRSARDSETNAFQTNCEAVDEICRQLRLRDLGGLVVNDLIDMYQHRHRREVEDRMKENLRRDRAKTTVLRISDFGIMEMTRQRMRPSLRSGHFVNCPTCQGNGEVKTAESVGGEIVRDVACMLQHDRVKRIEIVIPPRLGAALIRARRDLVRIEDESGKRVDVVVRDAVNDVTFYAYDDRNSDINIQQLPEIRMPNLADLEKAEREHEKKKDQGAESDSPSRSSRRRRRRRPGPADASEIALAGNFEAELEELEAKEREESEELGTKRKRPRRRRRRRRGEDDSVDTVQTVEATDDDAVDESKAESDEASRRSKKKRGRRGRGRKSEQATEHAVVEEVKASALSADTIRIYVLARELGVSSKEILARCAEQQLDVKNHMASVKGETLQTIRSWFVDDVPAEDEAPAKKPSGKKTTTKKKPRRRGRRGKGTSKQTEATSDGDTDQGAESPDAEMHTAGDDSNGAPRKKSRRRGGKRRRKSSAQSTGDTSEKNDSPAAAEAPSDDSKPERKSRRRRTRSSSKDTKPVDAVAESKPAVEPTIEVPKKRRTLYRNRTKVTPAARQAAETGS